MSRLRQIDKVAYVRFASVYQDFQDEQEFFNELKTLMKQQKVTRPGRPPEGE
jgi:transcriptional repressor NrdR